MDKKSGKVSRCIGTAVLLMAVAACASGTADAGGGPSPLKDATDSVPVLQIQRLGGFTMAAHAAAQVPMVSIWGETNGYNVYHRGIYSPETQYRFDDLLATSVAAWYRDAMLQEGWTLAKEEDGLQAWLRRDNDPIVHMHFLRDHFLVNFLHTHGPHGVPRHPGGALAGGCREPGRRSAVMLQAGAYSYRSHGTIYLPRRPTRGR